MSHDAEKRGDEVIHKLRKLNGFCPMTPEEADAAYDAAPSDPISEDDIDSMIEFVTSGGKATWEPLPDLGWTDEENIEEVEESLQLHRNKGEDEADTTEEEKLREEMLSDDETEDEDRLEGGEEPSGSGG
ncbi:hypothetical protein [Roseiconus lacunae]|uniref:Uncharacterized protein n=1 Tax=Roseiconus lacunae TaxID=2605694 RepID=A0ABT7PP40_9BACT|nr:hypothetical protein [Roseiconus lacunae]MDM4018230.1 hypothetical protein [Roseiconus lacunae]